MRLEEKNAASIWDMLMAARMATRIMEERSLEAFTAEGQDIVRLAIERELEILGEAARRVSEPYKLDHPEIPWKDIVALRNVISHQYEKVNYAVIYRICRERIPALITMLEPLVPSPPREEAQ
jgi:uncharacterized protein with HEPN domain